MDLRNRGVGDFLIALVDDLKGFAEAIAAEVPKTAVQTCVVHLIRNHQTRDLPPQTFPD